MPNDTILVATAERIGKGKAKAIRELTETIADINDAPCSSYLTGEKARIQAAIAILMGETYNAE